MKKCVSTPEGAKKIEVMKAAYMAFHCDWCDEIDELVKQLTSLAPRILFDKIQGKDLFANFIAALPKEAEVRDHHEALKLAYINSKVCYQCGGEPIPNVIPSMCEATYEVD